MLRLALVAALVAASVDATGRTSKWHDSLLNIRSRVLQGTPSPSPSASEVMSATGTMTGAATPSMTGAATPSMTAAMTPSTSAAVTSSMTGTASNSRTGTGTPTPSVTASVTAAVTPGVSTSNTATPSPTASTTPEGTRSATRSGSRTPAPTRSVGASVTRTPTGTATGTSSNLPSRSSSQTPRPSQSRALVSLPVMIPAVIVIKQTCRGIPVAAITIGIALELRRSFCFAVFSVALRRGLPPPPCTMRRICTRGGVCVTIEILAAVNIIPIRFLMESNSNDFSRLLPDMRFANFPRELQTSSDSDLVIDYGMEVEAPNNVVDNTGDGTSIVAAQRTQATELVSALSDTAGASAIAAAMEPAVVDAALAAGVTDLDSVSTTVDTAAAEVTVVNPRAPSETTTGLSGGAIAGIVIAVLVVTGLIVFGIVYASNKNRKPVAPAGAEPVPQTGADGAMV